MRNKGHESFRHSRRKAHVIDACLRIARSIDKRIFEVQDFVSKFPQSTGIHRGIQEMNWWSRGGGNSIFP